MRIRSTKPEFWRSSTIAKVDWDVRLVLKGLESYVDDNGVGKDDIALIIGDVFSRDMLASPRDTLARVSEALNTLHRTGLIWRYEVEGKKYLYVSNWEAIQRIDRPASGRYPRPDGTLEYRDSIIRECDTSPREDDTSPRDRNRGTEEQGNRGTGEQDSSRTADAVRHENGAPDAPDHAKEFATFWDAYPIKKDRAKALDAFRKARKRATMTEIMQGLANYNQELAANPDMKIKYAQGWLNGNRWEDEPTPTRHRPPVTLAWTQTNPPTSLQAIEGGHR